MSIFIIELGIEEGSGNEQRQYDTIHQVTDLHVVQPADRRYYSKDPYAKIFADGEFYAQVFPIHLLGFEFGSYTDEEGKTHPALYIDLRTNTKKPHSYNLSHTDLKLRPD